MTDIEDPRAATAGALHAAIGRDGIDRVVGGLLAEDVRWASTGPGGMCHSRGDVLRVLETQIEQGARPVLEAVRSVRDRVLINLRLSPDSTVWMVLRLDHDGRIAELQSYSNEAAAEHDLGRLAAGVGSPTVPAPVSRLVPFAHVADLGRSLAFYRQLGFEPTATHHEEGRLVWAALRSGDAEIMLAQAEEAVDTSAETVFFYLYAPDLGGLREHLVARGAMVGEIVDGTPGPKAEMRITDPDGYCLMVAESQP